MSQSILKSGDKPACDKSSCKTETFFDRDVELLICKEEKNCVYKKQHQKLTICLCK